MTDDKLLAAFVRRLRDEGHPDPATLANELIVMARGHGWRPTEALQPATVTGKPSEPNDEWQRTAAKIRERFRRHQ